MAADPLTSKTVGNILNYDMSDDDDPFADVAFPKARDDKATLSPRAAKRKADEDDDGFGLGLDEEVKITKKRKPVAKLDEARLLSQLGIPKLRAPVHNGGLAKKLRLKGKGHEFTDAARLLSFYQLWLDDLYPRAKFADGLQLIEKAGHSKRMQTMRREWIDEGKPGYLRDREAKKARTRKGEISDGEVENRASTGEKERAATPTQPRNSLFGNGLNEDDDDDMFFPDANKKNDDDGGDAPEDDDLDALLAEQTARPAAVLSRPTAHPDSEGEDDLDALLAEQEFNRAPEKKIPVVTKMTHIFDENYENDDDDLDALLADQEAHLKAPISKDSALPRQRKETARVEEPEAEHEPVDAVFSSSPIPNEAGNNDLNGLLAEQNKRDVPMEAPKSPARSLETETATLEAVTLEEPDAEMESTDFLPHSSQILNDEIDNEELDSLFAQFP